MIWNIVTDFGDSAAMLPAAVLLLGWLAIHRRVRAAVVWAALFAGQAAVVAATKIAFRGWGIGIEALDFTGLSGHSALACSVITIAFYLAAERAGIATRLAVALAGLAIGLLVGVSRVALAMHSWSEVIGACALGGLTAALFITLSDRALWDRGRQAAGRAPAPMIAAMLAVVVLLMHGTRAPSDQFITKIALHLSGHSVPYRRDPWRHRMPRIEVGSDAEAGPAIVAPERG